MDDGEITARTHAQCVTCWNSRHPGRAVDPDHWRYRRGATETCCWCDADTNAGIYVREAPEQVPCRGAHPDLGRGR